MGSNSNKVDEHGYPGTRQADGSFDGGDTAAIIGTMEAFLGAGVLKVRLPYNAGVPVRHPDTNKWYSEPDRFSRDQLIPNICSEIRDSFRPRYSKLFKAHQRRWFCTAWNTRGNGAFDKPKKTPDICGPSVWALWLRYRRPWWSRAVLGLLDLETLAGAINWRYLQPATNRVTRNHMLIVMFSYMYQPTLASMLAFKLANWSDLVAKWGAHCEAVGEYQTAYLFHDKLKELGVL